MQGPGGVSLQDIHRRARPVLVALPAAGLCVGLALRFVGLDGAQAVWAAATLPVLLALLIEIVGSLRRGDVGLDVVAALSMGGALLLGEQLAAVVVALMYAGGQYLESFAERRATRSLSALLARVPRTALRDQDGTLTEVPLNAVHPGDRLLIRRGDVIAVDGSVAAGPAVLDQSALTGEPLPVTRGTGETAMSGSTNVGEAFYLHASRTANESTYAGIVRLVEAAQRSRAPMARLADRFAVGFLALTVSIAGAAWLLSQDPVRALAVLVVATPCPLILAVPVAIISGVSRAARFGVLVKGGRALETLARVRALVIDKTGTLTYGRARVVDILPIAAIAPDELLRLAASVDQASVHVIARALVQEARERGLALAMPQDVEEVPGEGVRGFVDGRSVIVGGPGYVRRAIGGGDAAAIPDEADGAAKVAVAIDGAAAGMLILRDELRPDARSLVLELRELGIARIVMASGDRRDVAEAVSADLVLDGVHGDLTPEQKIEIVRLERAFGPVMMIGDGVNDAPALAAADLGIAMGTNGSAASAEAAEVVLLVDDLHRVIEAIRIARRSRRIALESVVAGIGLSLVGMAFAAFGYLSPVQGALLQEVIDVAVILNALRALGGGRQPDRDIPAAGPCPSLPRGSGGRPMERSI